MSIPPQPALLIFIPNCSTLTILLMYSFLILSFLVTLIANLNIFISATSISFTCFFVTFTVSSPYTIAGLTIELYTFPFTLAHNLLSQITPNTLLHPFHSACTLFVEKTEWKCRKTQSVIHKAECKYFQKLYRRTIEKKDKNFTPTLSLKQKAI